LGLSFNRGQNAAVEVRIVYRKEVPAMEREIKEAEVPATAHQAGCTRLIWGDLFRV